MPTTIDHPWKNRSKDAARPIVETFDSGNFVRITADADTDADGAPDARQIDPTGNPETSLGQDNGWKGDTPYVNARTIPYFVLPSNWKSVTGVACKLGDIARLNWNGRSVYAIYADNGTDDLIGEASIAAVQALGHDPWNESGTRIVTGIPFGVVYEIMPGSTNLKVTTSEPSIQAYGAEVFRKSAEDGTSPFPA